MSLAGRLLDERYHVDRFLGRGNSGEVYVGHDMLLDRPIAIKVLTSSEAAIRRRFVSEARAMALLSSPHIVTIYDFGEVDGVSYIVMEYVAGKMLRDVLDERAYDLAQLLTVFRSVTSALVVAHERAVIHRDLKPANILLGTDGSVKVADFGLARRMSDVTQHDASDEIAGTIAYLPPECFLGKAMDARGDLYSVGVLMYEAFSGALPFVTGPNDAVAMIYAHVNDVPVPPRALNRSMPQELERIILRLLEKRPDARFDSAQALLEALQAVSVSTGPSLETLPRRTIAEDADESVDPSIRALLDRMLSPQRATKEALGRVVTAMLALNRRNYDEATGLFTTALEEFRSLKNDPEFVKAAIRLGEALLRAAADADAPFDFEQVRRARVYLAEAGTIAYGKGLRREFEQCEKTANALEAAQIRRGVV